MGDSFASPARFTCAGMRARDVERFWKQVDRNGPVPAHQPQLGECWVWKGSLRGGYGQLWVGSPRVLVSAHRVAYELQVGPIPATIEGQDSRGPSVCHRCDNRLCVRGDHLFLGSHRTNIRDAWAKGRGRAPDVTGMRWAKPK